MSSLTSTARSSSSWVNWPDEAKAKLFARLISNRWRCDRPDCDGLPHKGWPWKHARTAQLPPPGGWRAWWLRGGRGSGKTRGGAEAFSEMVLDSPPGEWAVVGPTYGAGRDVCVEGESGLLSVLGGAVKTWNRSMGELRLHGGALIHVDGADDGAPRIQGLNLRGAWCDEPRLWQNWDMAWNESIEFAVRLDPGLIIVTGTARGSHGLCRQLVADPHVEVVTMRTRDNAANLSPGVLAGLEARWSGTRLGRQELEGEMVEDVEGALWTDAMIDALRVSEHPDLVRVVVGLDPSGGDEDGNDEQGIIVVGKGVDGDAYVLADLSCKLSPAGWGKRAVQGWIDYEADEIVAETNFGGDMVIGNVMNAASAMGVEGVRVKKVSASRGKVVRAEPVAALYEQGRVHHVGVFEQLERQQTQWTPDSGWSPDRMDGLVWALTELFPPVPTTTWRPL